jgi:hypothetical protein
VAWCVMFGPHGSLVPMGTILEIGACQLAVSDGARPRMSQSWSVWCVSCHQESESWYAWQDSNLRPVAPEATALSI